MAWKIYSLTVVVLFLKMFAVVLVQTSSRVTSNTFANPEDAAVLGKKGTPTVEESPILQRASKVLRNDGENIPIFLFLAGAYVQLGCWPTGVFIYFPLFVLTRILHTIAYIRVIQPLRTRVYQLGLLVLFILCGHIIWTAFHS